MARGSPAADPLAWGTPALSNGRDPPRITLDLSMRADVPGRYAHQAGGMNRLSAHRVPSAWALALVTCGLSVLCGWLALHGVDGVQRVKGSTYSTGFVNGEWVVASWLLPVPICVVARLHPFIGVGAALLCSGVGIHVSLVTIDRYQESGWADGLESLGFVFALLAGAVTVICAVVAGLLGHRSRARAARVLVQA